MALKQEPMDRMREPVYVTDSGSPHSGPATSATSTPHPVTSTPHPVHFLGEQAGAEMMLDPAQEEVVFLPHRAPSGRAHHRMQGVTEYANYSISHLEAELNSKHLPKKYRCRFCVYKTSYKSDLNRHLKKHGIALQHCPLCNMPFKTAGNLKNHMMQAHSDVVQSVDNIPSPLSGCGLKEDFLPSRRMEASPEMDNSQVGGHGHDAVMPVTEPDRDFPVVSQTLPSPHQLYCHMCPFVSSDAQVLARHILTHPGEEEASRAPHCSPQNLTVPRLSCSVCGAAVSSLEELQAHRCSCTDSENCDQGKQRKGISSLDSDRVDLTKLNHTVGTESGDQHGLPREETISKLRRTMTNQIVSDDYHASSSVTRQTFSKRKDSTTMVLPHVPAVAMGSTIPDLNIAKSQHPASSVDEAEDQEEPHIFESVNPSSVYRRNFKNQARTCTESADSPFSKEVSRLITAEQEQAASSSRQLPHVDSIHHSEGRLQRRGQNRDLPLQHPESRGRQRSATISSAEQESESLRATDLHENVSDKVKRLSSSVDCQPSDKEDARKQRSHMTLLIKKEPQSPNAPADLEESEKNYEAPFRSCAMVTRSDSVRNSAGRERYDCDLCGQLFRDRAQLSDHMKCIHILPSEPGLSSVRIQANRTGSSLQCKQSTNRNVRVSEKNYSLPKYQDYGHSKHTISLHKDVIEHSQEREVYQRVTSQPPRQGRYAVLVSDFDEFASKPYACSLCFFRTAHLSELSVHVNYHLTGGSSIPPAATAGFQSKEPLLAERGTSPFKADSEDGLICESVVLSHAVRCSVMGVSCENGGARPSNEQNVTFQVNAAEQSSKTRSPVETRQTHGDSVDRLHPISAAVSDFVTAGKDCYTLNTAGSTSSAQGHRPYSRSSNIPGRIRLWSATLAGVLDESNASADQDHGDSKEENKQCSEGYADPLMDEDNGDELQSQEAQPVIQNVRNTPTGSTQPARDPLFDEGFEDAHDIQNLSVLSKDSEENAPVTANRDIFANKNKSTDSQLTCRSSKKSSHVEAQPRAPKNKRQRHAKSPARTRVPVRSDGVKKGSWQHHAKSPTRARVPVRTRGSKQSAASAQSYQCEQCGRSFSWRQILVRHLRFVHSDSVSLCRKNKQSIRPCGHNKVHQKETL